MRNFIKKSRHASSRIDMKEKRKSLIIDILSKHNHGFCSDLGNRFPDSDFDTISDLMTGLERVQGKHYHKIFFAISPEDPPSPRLWATYGSIIQEILRHEGRDQHQKGELNSEKIFSDVNKIPLSLFTNPKNRSDILHKIKDGRRTYFMKEKEITYIKSDSYYCDYILENRRITARQSLTHLQSVFVNFKRVHRSFLVNPVHIDYVERLKTKTLCVMKNGDQIPVSDLEKVF